MSQPQVKAIIECGGGLYFNSAVLFGTLRSFKQNEDGSVDLFYADNTDETLTAQQGLKFMQSLGLTNVVCVKSPIIK